jgi:3-hydroxyacyl-[acyl-carrier-protein] dehydratase
VSDTFETPLHIAAQHPALPGHFPGRPLVPGVVLLERVAAACKAWRSVRVRGLDAKFMQPLLPDQNAVIALRADGAGVRFRVTRTDGTALASGTCVTVASEDDTIASSPAA